MNKWTLFKSYSFLLGLLMSLGFVACSSQLKKQTQINAAKQVSVRNNEENSKRRENNKKKVNRKK